MWVSEKISYLAGTLLEYSYLYYLGTTQEIVIKGGELICSHIASAIHTAVCCCSIWTVIEMKKEEY